MNTSQIPRQALKLPQVCQRTATSRAALYRLCARGLFPQPFKIGGGRAVAWLESDVNDWLEAQAANRTK